jgi:16S rRNA (cytosine(967)-C(5))-methyltransferase
MQLPSLLGHSAQLYSLLERSPRPADVLASEYFRSKKYIGAKERRFISQVVFSSLRGRSVFAYCASEALAVIADDVQAVHNANNAKTGRAKKTEHELLFDELAIITATALLGNQVGVGNIFDSIEQTLGIPYQDLEGRTIALGEAFGVRADVSLDAGVQFAAALCDVWSALEQEIEAIFSAEDFSVYAQDRVAMRFAVPHWILASLQESNNEVSAPGTIAAPSTIAAGDWFSAVELAASLLSPAPLSLRVNTLAADRESVVAIFREDGIPARLGKLSPHAVLIDKRVNLTTTNMYREGVIEVQDEASQLAGFALAPEAKWRILDACAGAGGKSLHLGILQGNRGEIIASDIEYQRLKELPQRAQRSGLSTIITIQLDRKRNAERDTPQNTTLPSNLAHLNAACDAVVVDAPCSGMGTVRRMPMTKWRLTPEMLHKHGRKQREILTTFSHAVKPGGVLLYSTCSLMPQENGQVVAAFLAENPDFEPDALAPAFAQHGIHIPNLAPDAAMLTLTPAQHGTDGFFVARMRRKEDS